MTKFLGMVTLGLMVHGLFATSIQATETKRCHTAGACRQLKAEVEVDLKNLLDNELPEMTRMITGVSYTRAKQICERKHNDPRYKDENKQVRMLTARELALISQRSGAIGIKEFDEFSNEDEAKDNGYLLIKGTDSAGNPDNFYFNNKGYVTPRNRNFRNLHLYSLWSSSPSPDWPDSVYKLEFRRGQVDVYSNDDRYNQYFNSVQCAVIPEGPRGQVETKQCHTIQGCRRLLTEVEADLAIRMEIELTIPTQVPELTEILNWAPALSQRQAEATCKRREMRLPTAREFALLAQSLGAEGISETPKYGYNLIRGTDREGNPDTFYYSNKGYIAPEGHNGGNYWFWSSSNHTELGDGYVLFGVTGHLSLHRDYDVYDNAARCVKENQE